MWKPSNKGGKASTLFNCPLKKFGPDQRTHSGSKNLPNLPSFSSDKSANSTFSHVFSYDKKYCSLIYCEKKNTVEWLADSAD